MGEKKEEGGKFLHRGGESCGGKAATEVEPDCDVECWSLQRGVLGKGLRSKVLLCLPGRAATLRGRERRRRVDRAKEGRRARRAREGDDAREMSP